MGSVTECNILGCSTCVDNVNPYDISTWGYITETPPDPEKATQCNSTQQGDVYSGMIVNKCESNPQNPNGNPDYVYSTFLKSKDSKPAGPCNIVKCDERDKGYGSCNPFSGNHHWYARRWDLMTTDQAMECCVTDPKANDRTKNCPTSLWYGAPLCTGEFVQSYCTSEKWNETCDNIVQKNLESTDGNPTSGATIFLKALDEWASDPHGADDSFLPVINKWCNHPKLRGVCNMALQKGCKNVTQDQLSKDSRGNLTNVCACYLSPKGYYLPGIIPPECASTCTTIGNSGGTPLYYYDSTGTAQTKVCQQGTCVMDGTTVNVINSKLGGTVDFSQMCGNCPGCTCVMNDVDINVINSKLKNGVTISQKCGYCTKVDSQGKTVDVNCTTGQPLQHENYIMNKQMADDSKSSKKWWYIGIGLLVMLILIIIIVIVARHHKGSSPAMTPAPRGFGTSEIL